MASWFDDLLGNSITQKAINFGANAGTNAVIDYFGGNDPQIAMAGYQGSVPELSLIHI